MAWTASIFDKRFDAKGRALIAVEFTDGTDVVREALKPSDATHLDQLIAARLEAFDRQAKLVDALSPGQRVPPAPPVPTQAEQDRREFQRLWGRLQQVQKAVDAGLVQAADARVTSYRTTVQAAFAKVVANDGPVAALELL